jgi:hypothetical protein
MSPKEFGCVFIPRERVSHLCFIFIDDDSEEKIHFHIFILGSTAEGGKYVVKNFYFLVKIMEL